MLRDGELDDRVEGSKCELSVTENTQFEKKLVFESYYYSKAADSKYKNRVVERAFFKKLYDLLPEIPKDKKVGPKGQQVRVIVFPPLVRCRELFQKAVMETKWEWDE